MASAEPVEDVNDDLVGGAFAAKERNRIGDFDFAEHPLERRANEAYSNDCKVQNRVYRKLPVEYLKPLKLGSLVMIFFSLRIINGLNMPQ